MRNVPISVVVITSNNPYALRTLSSVVEQLDCDDELIVVDDHTEDEVGLRAIEKFCTDHSAQFIKTSMRGNRSHNRNLGGAKATKEVVLFTDGDIVLDDYAILTVKNAHQSRPEIAYAGFVSNMRLDPNSFSLWNNMEEYLELLKTREGRIRIRQESSFSDTRAEIFKDYPNSIFNWSCYFSGLCSVLLEDFVAVGGFDESFKTWGAEDVDLGYRLAQRGIVSMLEGFRCFHIPHPRDILQREKTSAENCRRLQLKYRSWEFETLSVYNGNTELLEHVYYVISRMRKASVPAIGKCDAKDCVYFEPFSREKSTNCIVVFDQNGTAEELPYIGLSIPYADNSIGCAYVSQGIFMYPHSIATRILQEAMRVSSRVFIVKISAFTSIDWAHLSSLSCEPSVRTSYNSADIMDFKLENKGSFFEVGTINPEIRPR